MTNERRTNTAGEIWEKESKRRELSKARSKERSKEQSERSEAEVKQEKRDRKSKAA